MLPRRAAGRTSTRGLPHSLIGPRTRRPPRQPPFPCTSLSLSPETGCCSALQLQLLVTGCLHCSSLVQELQAATSAGSRGRYDFAQQHACAECARVRCARVRARAEPTRSGRARAGGRAHDPPFALLSPPASRREPCPRSHCATRCHGPRWSSGSGNRRGRNAGDWRLEMKSPSQTWRSSHT